MLVTRQRDAASKASGHREIPTMTTIDLNNMTADDKAALLAALLPQGSDDNSDSQPTLDRVKLANAIDVSTTVNISTYREFNSGNHGFTVGMRIVVDGRLFIGTLNLVDDTRRVGKVTSTTAGERNGQVAAGASNRRVAR